MLTQIDFPQSRKLVANSEEAEVHTCLSGDPISMVSSFLLVLFRHGPSDKGGAYFLIVGGVIGMLASLFSRKVRPAFSARQGEGVKPDFTARAFGFIVSAGLTAAGIYRVLGGSLCMPH